MNNVTVPYLRVERAVRADLAASMAPNVREAEAALGRAVVMVLLDPTDPRAAQMMPALAAAYGAAQADARPSVVMVVANGGTGVFSVEREGLVVQDDRELVGEPVITVAVRGAA